MLCVCVIQGGRGGERAREKQTVGERERERKGDTGWWVSVEEGADKSFYWKIVPGLCQQRQHQRPPANESSLATAVTGRQVRALSCTDKKGIILVLYVGRT